MTTLGGPALWVELIESDEGDRILEIPASALASFEFIDTDTGTDVAKLSLSNADMRWYDESAFRAGQKLNLTWGWESAMCTPRRMVVKKPSQGSNPIIITLHDEGTLMNKVPKKRHWSGLTDGQIASAIAEENGYSGLLQDITATVAVREGTTQIGTDAGFLTTLARRNGFRWWIDGTGLHWGNRHMGAEPSKFYVYKNDLKGEVLTQPEIKANLTRDVAKVKVLAIDPLTRKEVSAEVGVATGDETLGDYVSNIISLGAEEEIADPSSTDSRRAARVSRSAEINMGSATAEEVATEAERIYRMVASNRYKMTVTVVGDPVVGAKQLHHWTFPSEVMGGLWYCKKATTSITPGKYILTLEYIKDALGKLFLGKIHPVTRKNNLVTGDITAAELGYTKKATLYEENGQLVPAWHWVDEEGKTVGKAWAQTTEDVRELADSDSEEAWDSMEGSKGTKHGALIPRDPTMD